MIDQRYGTIKVLIQSGHIKSFPDIFQYIPKTTVYKDLGINFNRFGKAIYDPTIFRLNEIFRLAEMFDVDDEVLVRMACEQIACAKKMKEKRRKYPRTMANSERPGVAIVQKNNM